MTMDQPVSGNLTANTPQQPSGSVSWGSYSQGDYVQVHWENYGMNSEHASQTVQCDEYWNTTFTDGGWSALTDFDFPYEGMWSVSAYHNSSGNQNLGYASSGGGITP